MTKRWDRDELAPFFEIEADIVRGAKGFRVLSSIQWPQSVLDEFLRGWRAGEPRLPVVETPPPEGCEAVIETMEACMRRTPQDHPLGDLLWKTAWSYSTAARMLLSTGTPAFSERSIELYGRPDVKRPSQGWSDLDAAEFLLAKSADLLASCAVPDVEATLSAEDLAAGLRARINPRFTEDPIEVVIAPELASKASAASSRVRLRADARFSELDLDQLFQHEVMVHSATMLNGIRQPHLDVLGLGAPRTTRTQEGLATLAEILTGSMDLVRLRRIALRVRAVALALGGANFIEVFEMFLAEGQSEEESLAAAARVFRGGDARGGTAFTKDGTYVAGLLEVHAFLRIAVRDGRPELIPLLFAGRVTIGDVVVLAPLAESGLVAPPRYIPTWAADLRRLTALLTYSTFQTYVDLEHIDLEAAVRMDLQAMEGSAASESAQAG
jgi:uncharacterized protein (TIGR02421 family)